MKKKSQNSEKSSNNLSFISSPYNREKPRDGETSVSYIIRLAKMNGISESDYKKIIVGDKNPAHAESDALKMFGTGMSIAKFINDLTIYPAISCAVSWYDQMAMIANFQESFKKFDILFNSKTLNQKLSMTCPLCMREDKRKYGEWYYHREHQIPGVKCCPYHNVKLIKVANDDVSTDDRMNNNIVKASYAEIKYSKFTLFLLINGFESTKEKTTALIIKRIKERFPQKDYIIQCESYIRNSGASELFENVNLSYLIAHISANSDVRIENILAMLMLFCMDDVLNQNKNKPYFIPKDYELLESYPNLIFIRHGCGNEFAVSPSAFELGVGCPNCDNCKDSDEKYEELVKMINPEYVKIQRFGGMGHKIAFLHTCGRISETRAKNFFKKRVCKCEIEPSEKRIKQYVESCGFELIDVKLGSTNNETIVTLEHKKCGTLLMKTYSEFRANPSCRLCTLQKMSQRFMRSQETYENLVNRISGGEYKVVGKYTGNSNDISIRHELCGTITRMPAKDFIEGRRCPFCGIPFEKSFINSVSLGTNGKYQINKEKKGIYNITDNDTGKTVRNMTRPMILQELTRGDKSDILPLSDEQKKIMRIYALGPRGMIYILTHGNGDFSIQDACTKLYGTNIIQDHMRKLVNDGYIVKMKNGLYHWRDAEDFSFSLAQSKRGYNIIDLIFAIISVSNCEMSINNVVEASGLSYNQVSHALTELCKKGKIHRTGRATYVIGDGENTKYLTEMIFDKIKNSFNDRIFWSTDIKIDGYAAPQISAALRQLALNEKITRIEDGLYVMNGVKYDNKNCFAYSRNYVRHVIQGKSSFKPEDIPVTDHFTKQMIVDALNTMIRNNEIVRISYGTYKMKNTDKEVNHYQSGDYQKAILSVLSDGALDIKTISQKTGLSVSTVRGRLHDLLVKEKVHQVGIGHYALGKGKEKAEYLSERVRKLIIKKYDSNDTFNANDIASEMVDANIEQIRSILKRFLKNGEIKHTDKKGVYRRSDEECQKN